MRHDSLRLIVVEDEQFMSEMIEMMVSNLGHEVIGVAHNKTDAIELINGGTDYDFAILDIDIEGKHEGLEMAHLLREKNMPFMFLTSHADRNTLLSAKESQPGAYVMKPFTQDELFAGIEMSLMHHDVDIQKSIQVKDGHKSIRLEPNEILYVKADNIYIEIYTKTKKIVSRQTLSSFQESVSSTRFIRVHRSYLVNRNNVDSISSTKLEVSGHEIPVSRSFKSELQRVFGSL